MFEIFAYCFYTPSAISDLPLAFRLSVFIGISRT
jgi:hypothetical protein